MKYFRRIKMNLKSLISEIRLAKECLKAGRYEDVYVALQNLDDELTTMAIKEESNATTDNENV